MSDQTEDFELVWHRLEYATEEHAKILVVNADLRQRIAELQEENKLLKEQNQALFHRLADLADDGDETDLDAAVRLLKAITNDQIGENK